MSTTLRWACDDVLIFVLRILCANERKLDDHAEHVGVGSVALL